MGPGELGPPRRQIWKSRQAAVTSSIHLHADFTLPQTITLTAHCSLTVKVSEVIPYAKMSSRSLGELLLRPSSLARTPLYQTSNITRVAPQWTSRRYISNGSSQAFPQPAQSNNNDAAAPSSQETPNSQSREDASSQSPFSNPPTQHRQKPFPTTQQQPSSADQLSASRNPRPFGSEFSDPAAYPRGSRAPPRLNFDDMMFSDSLLDPNTSSKPSESAVLAAQQEETFSNYPRLNPTYGRTVDLNPARGRDLVRGISMLGSLMGRNKIKQEFMKQRFHERGGLKRKRLASERWRARFRKGFTKITGRVAELTRKGW